MKLLHAISRAAKTYRQRGRMDVYRSAHPDYIFTYVPEYSNKTEYVWNDTNVWVSGIGGWGEMLIPLEWIKEDDWEAYETD